MKIKFLAIFFSLCSLFYASSSLAAAPSSVQEIRVNNITEDGFWLSWQYNQSTENITAYNIYLNETKVGSVDPNKTVFVADELEPGHKYSVRVSAVNADGENLLSDPLQVETLSRLPLPPENLIVKKEGNQVVLAWSPSDLATGYVVSLNGYKQQVITETRFTMNSLQYGNDYEIKVYAVNKSGESTESETILYSLEKVISPKAPKVVHVDHQAAFLSWEPVDHASQYKIRITKQEDLSFLDVMTNETAVSVSDLTEDTMYYFQVASVDSYGVESELTDRIPFQSISASLVSRQEVLDQSWRYVQSLSEPFNILLGLGLGLILLRFGLTLLPGQRGR